MGPGITKPKVDGNFEGNLIRIN